MNCPKYCFTIFIFFVGFTVKAQSNFGFKIFPISINPTDTRNSALYQNKLDADGMFILEAGIMASHQVFLGNTHTSIEIIAAVHHDCTEKIAGFINFGIHRKLVQYYKHSFTIGIGPTIFLRQDWSAIDGYIQDSDYTLKGQTQYKISWLSGELEYNYYLAKNADLAVSVNHIHPESITVAVGLVVWISRKGKKHCNTCPSFNRR